MAITVTMIEEKEFKTKVRGYDPVEVDEFLDEICDEMIEMQGTIQTLRDQLKQKAAEYTASSFAPLPVAPLASAASVPLSSLAPLPLHKGEEDEERLPADLIAAKKLLEKTQRACDEVLSDARKRADGILKEAEDLVPDAELEDLEAQREQVRQEIEKLKSEAEIFRRRFQSMLKDQNDILETDLF